MLYFRYWLTRARCDFNRSWQVSQTAPTWPVGRSDGRALWRGILNGRRVQAIAGPWLGAVTGNSRIERLVGRRENEISPGPPIVPSPRAGYIFHDHILRIIIINVPANKCSEEKKNSTRAYYNANATRQHVARNWRVFTGPGVTVHSEGKTRGEPAPLFPRVFAGRRKRRRSHDWARGRVPSTKIPDKTIFVKRVIEVRRSCIRESYPPKRRFEMHMVHIACVTIS